MDLFDNLDWTQCQLLNVIPVRATANPHLQRYFADTTFYQIGVKFHGRTVIYYNKQEILFDTGSILYLPKETRTDVPYNKRILENGEGVSIFFDSPVPLTPEPVLFPGSPTGHYPLDLFSKLVHTWQEEDNPLEAMSLFYQILAQLYRCTHTVPQQKELRVRLSPAVAWLDDHCQAPYPDLQMLAELCGLSREYFRQCFQNTYHVTPLQYLHHRKLQLAKELLTGTALPIAHVARQCGFDDGNYFARFFRQHTGLSPSRYRSLYRTQM